MWWCLHSDPAHSVPGCTLKEWSKIHLSKCSPTAIHSESQDNALEICGLWDIGHIYCAVTNICPVSSPVKSLWKSHADGACLYSQHLGGWGRGILSLRPASAPQWDYVEENSGATKEPMNTLRRADVLLQETLEFGQVCGITVITYQSLSQLKSEQSGSNLTSKTKSDVNDLLDWATEKSWHSKSPVTCFETVHMWTRDKSSWHAEVIHVPFNNAILQFLLLRVPGS